MLCQAVGSSSDSFLCIRFVLCPNEIHSKTVAKGNHLFKFDARKKINPH